MNHQEHFYPESRYGGFTDVDGTIAFYTRVNALLNPQSVVVDFGCGRGAYAGDTIPQRAELRKLKGKVFKVIGLDFDPVGATNPFLDEFHRVDNGAWPLPSGSVDLCLCDNVLEHLSQPEKFFTEAQRVLRPGGDLCIRTPNAWNYIAFLSRLVPNRQHAQVLGKVKDRSNPQDVFPTFYRCNTLPELRKMLRQHGFEGVVYGYEAEPTYLSFSGLAYWLGVMHQRYAPHIFKAAIFAFAST